MCYNKPVSRVYAEMEGIMMKKKGTLLMVVWILAAALLVAAGIGCLVNSADITSILADWMGIVLIVSGVLQLVVNYLLRDTIFGLRSFLTKAVVTVIVGVVILCQSFIAGEVIRVLISVMILVDGISVIGAALDMNRDRIPGRGWLWIIGLIEALLGLSGFLKPEILSITLGILLGVSLIYEGLVLGYTCFMAMKWRRLMIQ